MGKVIALKLTDKEERIISRLNQEGISNSELIRDALWHYFRTVNQPVNCKVNNIKDKQVNPEVNQVNQTSSEKNNGIFYDYVFSLKNEVNQLREESNKFQKDFQEETKNIRKLFYENLPVINLTKKEDDFCKKNNFSDVHEAIDQFLNTRTK